MPMVADVKSKSRSKRKPLRDVSNGGIKPSARNLVMQKPIPDTPQQDPVTTRGDGASRDPLDRLLLVHSDLSVLIHQIDELVVQALEQKVKNKKEIESFTHVLTEIQTSFKPWVSRFQKLLSTHATASKNQLQVQPTLPSTKKIPPSITTHTNTIQPLENQDTYKLDFMVSPSPLVSWHADCTKEGGKNLFLLTPLPRPSKSILKNTTNVKKETLELEFSSPEKLVRRNNNNNNNNCMIVSTPCVKMSPPKSCILLEPASEYHNKNTNVIKKPVINPGGGGGGGGDSEPCSSSKSYGHLGLKYPELFGIKHVGNARKAVEASPNWCISPPKTCVLLEPSDNQDLEIKLPKPLNKGVVDCTPMCKGVETTAVRGWRAGENTLKKELWMRFEAATCYKLSEGGQTSIGTSNGCSSNNKGFMELLEEVCSDD